VTPVPKTGEYNSCLAKWNIPRRFSLCTNSGFHFGNYFSEEKSHVPAENDLPWRNFSANA
jgi:hypothetical protein